MYGICNGDAFGIGTKILVQSSGSCSNVKDYTYIVSIFETTLQVKHILFGPQPAKGVSYGEVISF